MQPNHEQFLELYRNGIRSASDMGQAWLQVSLRLHEKQLEAMRGMVDENARTAGRLGEAHSIQDLLTLQSRLASEQVQRVARYWSTMWQAAADNGQTMIGQVRDQVQSQAGRAAEFGARVRESAPANNGKQEQHRKSA